MGKAKIAENAGSFGYAQDRLFDYVCRKSAPYSAQDDKFVFLKEFLGHQN
jgi:hypothetical protein